MDIPIMFEESDVVEGHHDGLVISLPVGKRILVDNGSSANIIMLDTLKHMNIDEKNIINKSTMLVGLRRPWIHEMKAIPSTYHQVIKFPTRWGIQEIRGDPKEDKECYKIALKAIYREEFSITIRGSAGPKEVEHSRRTRSHRSPAEP
ncbi:uncharacterized protein LOC110731428 [Chenopodium quinoa]|uniref:uncharacterized protein LOC110731428 n=1 Tax=Chenopodium quinoa TaxID=63459 RepID=UPI000B7838C7|nr:uncharacterized protein LOC110731428 [Chenopodium quinoa]